MRPTDLEFRALQVLDIIESKKPFEDSLVELKAQWPDVLNDEKGYQTARQMAGHLNSARGDAVIWLIGVSEKTGICGAPTKDLANEWWPSLHKWFDHSPPSLMSRVVGRDGKTVTAMRFDGSLVPFVVKVLGKTRELDVPWQDGGTRSATRSELIRVLAPETRRPFAEVLHARIDGESFVCTLLIVVRGSEPVRFVEHRTSVEYDWNPDWLAPVELRADRSKAEKVEPWIHTTPTGIVMDRGGTLIVLTRCPQPISLRERLTIRLAMADPTEPPLAIPIELSRRGDSWLLND